MDIKDLARHYYDTAKIDLTLRTPEGVSEETITVAHKIIDRREWEQLKTIEADADNPIPVAARQLVSLDTFIKNLTDDGEPVEFTEQFWTDLKPPILRQRIIDAVTGNIPASTLLYARLSEITGGTSKEEAKDVNDKEHAAEHGGDTETSAQYVDEDKHQSGQSSG